MLSPYLNKLKFVNTIILSKLIALDAEMKKERNWTPLLNYTKEVTDMATQKEAEKN